MNSEIINSKHLNDIFEIRCVNYSTSKKIRQIGKVSLHKIYLLLRLILLVIRQVISARPDLCYITPAMSGWGLIKDLILAALLKVFRIKICYHLHGKVPEKARLNRLIRLIHRIIYRNSHLIVLSPLLKDHYWFGKWAKSIHIVPNGVLKRSFTGKKHSFFRVLYFSNMIKEKGPLNVLKSAAIIKRWGLGVEFCFVGKWADFKLKSEFFDYVKEHSLEKTVVFYEGFYGEDKYVCFNESDIFILPTFYANECFPLVLLEAMSFGLPVITSDAGAIADIIDDNLNGFIVDPHNSEELAQKIRYLYDNPEMRSKMGLSGFEKYQNHFTLDIFENKLAETLQELTG